MNSERDKKYCKGYYKVGCANTFGLGQLSQEQIKLSQM